MELMIYIWIAVFFIAIIVEILVPGMVSIWFAPAAFIALILAAFRIPIPAQIAVFFVVAVACLFGMRPLLDKVFGKKKEFKTNIDAIIGEKGIVTEPIDNLGGCGQVKINGMYWAARSMNEEKQFVVGDVVLIRAVEGVKLIVSEAEK